MISNTTHKLHHQLFQVLTDFHTQHTSFIINCSRYSQTFTHNTQASSSTVPGTHRLSHTTHKLHHQLFQVLTDFHTTHKLHHQLFQVLTAQASSSTVPGTHRLSHTTHKLHHQLFQVLTDFHTQHTSFIINCSRYSQTFTHNTQASSSTVPGTHRLSHTTHKLHHQLFQVLTDFHTQHTSFIINCSRCSQTFTHNTQARYSQTFTHNAQALVV